MNKKNIHWTTVAVVTNHSTNFQTRQSQSQSEALLNVWKVGRLLQRFALSICDFC